MGNTVTYHRGTLEEFNTWHQQVKLIEDLPKAGYRDDIPVPENQQTINYSEVIKNPLEDNDYIWMYGNYPIEDKEVLSSGDILILNWFPRI